MRCQLVQVFFIACLASFSFLKAKNIKPQEVPLIKQLDQIKFDDKTQPVVILGGGVAGLTAAVYLAQAEIKCVVIEGQKRGGALSENEMVRNWPGVFNLPGSQIINTLKQQAHDNGVTILQEKAIGFNHTSWPYQIELEHLVSHKKRTINALTCLIATGVEPNYLNVPGERSQNGHWVPGVTNCTVCDGILYKNKRVAVVGNDDMAIQHAANLAVIAKNVSLLVPQADFKVRNVKKMRETIDKPNVHVVYNVQVKKIGGDGKQVTSIEFADNRSKKIESYQVDGIFLATGSKPNTQLFKDRIELDQDGYIVLKHGQLTSLTGVYAAGDVHNRHHKQTITAAAAGCNAALQIKDFLGELGYDAQKYQPVKQEINFSVDSKEQQEGISDNRVIEISSMDQLKGMISKKMSESVIFDFYLPECTNCQGMFPLFKELSHDQRFEKIKFVKVNIDTFDPDVITQKLGKEELKTLPTFLFVQRGKERGRLVGPHDKESFQNEIIKAFKIQ